MFTISRWCAAYNTHSCPGHNSGENACKKNSFTIIYTSCLVICASLIEFSQIKMWCWCHKILWVTITKGYKSGRNGSRKKSFLYNHLQILLDPLCKFERNPPYWLIRIWCHKIWGTYGRTDECNFICRPLCGVIKKILPHPVPFPLPGKGAHAL